MQCAQTKLRKNDLFFIVVLLSLSYFIPSQCYIKQNQNQWGNLKLQPELLDSVETKVF